MLQILLQEHEESELKRGAGGRIKELEGPEVMADEFAPVGMARHKATVAAQENIFKEYDAALREKEEVSDIRCRLLTTPTHPVGPVFYNSPSSKTPAHSVT